MNEANMTSRAGETDLSGQRLGDYELIRRLGRGGMADVYLARQTSLGRQVAIKVLRPTLASDEKYVRRFHQEARAAASLVHANIVQIHEVGCANGFHYIAQEYVPGQNLRQYMQRNGPLDVRLALRVLRQVAAALHRSAQAQIIHRDIKPENIMLSTTGEVKVADFGLARVAVSEDGVDLTQIGMTMGTPLYMSPEQVEGKAVDPRSDIYSLGVTCFHMLAGRPPFSGETALSVAVQHLQQQPERLDKLRSDLPPALCRIIHRMLSKSVDERYQSPAELLKDLRTVRLEDGNDEWSVEGEDWSDPELLALANGRWEATTHLATVLKSQTLARRRARRHALLGIVGILVALLIGAGLGWSRRPALLLEVEATDLPEIEVMPTAREQLTYAALLASAENGPPDGGEAALKSVERFFPPSENPENQLYARQAQRHLGLLYLSRNELDKAEQVFTQLAEVEESEKGFRAAGLIGQAVVYARRGDDERAVRQLAQVPEIDRREFTIMRELEPLIEQLPPDLRRRWVSLRRIAPEPPRGRRDLSNT